MRVLPMQCMEFICLYRPIGTCVTVLHLCTSAPVLSVEVHVHLCVCERFPPPVGPGCSAPLLGRGPFPIPGSRFPVPGSRFLAPIQPPSRDHLALGDDEPMARKEPLLSALKEPFLSLLLVLTEIDFSLDLQNCSFLDESWLLPVCSIYETVPCRALGMVLRYVDGRVFVTKVLPESQAEVDEVVLAGDILDEINGCSLRYASPGQVGGDRGLLSPSSAPCSPLLLPPSRLELCCRG
ncbi:uncharacterized protein LOC121363898 [Pyrgilauda ruficollis]|uniref:uncharacterized protein LOC121363898 n=1 Tax=Pyrgilauda ruficollis TaxID=221976 RepID=UPI001B876954|nr:uncharacterized protein LOC121363898 [Pyrgilauda ruficollis]